MKLKTLTKNLLNLTLIDLYEDEPTGRNYIGQTAADSIGWGSDVYDLRLPLCSKLIKCVDDHQVKEWWVAKTNQIAVVLRKESK